MSFFISRREKKKEQIKRNKYHQMLYDLVRIRRNQADHEREERTEREKRKKLAMATAADQNDDLIWSAKVGEIRNRLTGKKRASVERWNRFAGTEDGGARGL